MLNPATVQQVFLACGSTDLRKSIDGLAIQVQMEFQIDPFSSHLFVFCNRERNKLKILHWDHNGFWLYYRRLERGKFEWPQKKSTTDIMQTIDWRALRWLLDGLALTQHRSHPAVHAQTMV